MSDVFISYARSTTTQAKAVAEALRAAGHGVWLDDELPAHRGYAEVIEERLEAAKAVVVIWSAEAVKSEWVQSEADRARENRKLVQLTIDGAKLPMPFDRIQCADLTGWTGDTQAPGWRKIMASIADLVGGKIAESVAAADVPLPLPNKPSIAVLPFANLSGDPEQEYFADGMVVEIVEALSRIRSIFVIASASSLSFKGKAVGPREAARQLGVRYVLEGTVRKAGGRVRIGVQLIDAEDGAQIWTHRFEDTLEDVFALQEKVALAVAGKIEPTVGQAELGRALARSTESMSAYDLVLRAIPLSRNYSRANTLQARDLLNRAVALDPDYGFALSAAGVTHFLVGIHGWSDEDPEDHRRRGREMTQRAVRLCGDDATALSWAAHAVAQFERLSAGIALADRAIALNPGCAEAWFVSGNLRVQSGEPNVDLGVEHLETAMRLDPMGPNRPNQITWVGVARFRQGRFAEVVANAEEVVQQTENPIGPALLAAGYGHLGRRGEALAALARYRALLAVPIQEYARGLMEDPVFHKLFDEGIALAEGKTLAAGESAAP